MSSSGEPSIVMAGARIDGADTTHCGPIGSANPELTTDASESIVAIFCYAIIDFAVCRASDPARRGRSIPSGGGNSLAWVCRMHPPDLRDLFYILITVS